MAEADLEGKAVLRWLKETPHDRAAEILIGCGLDNGVDEELLVIEELDVDFVLQCRLGLTKKRIPPTLLQQSIVVDNKAGHPLKAAIEQTTPEYERILIDAKRKLQNAGIPAEKLTRSADLFSLIEVLEAHEHKRLPTPELQEELYDLIKRANLLQLGAKIIEGWRNLELNSNGYVDGDILIRLAYCWRHSGQIGRALEASKPVVEYDKTVRITPAQKAVLATERAAALMDLFEIRRDQQLLSAARRCAGIAWAISQSQETSLVYERLKSLEG